MAKGAGITIEEIMSSKPYLSSYEASSSIIKCNMKGYQLSCFIFHPKSQTKVVLKAN